MSISTFEHLWFMGGSLGYIPCQLLPPLPRLGGFRWLSLHGVSGFWCTRFALLKFSPGYKNVLKLSNSETIKEFIPVSLSKLSKDNGIKIRKSTIHHPSRTIIQWKNDPITKETIVHEGSIVQLNDSGTIDKSYLCKTSCTSGWCSYASVDLGTLYATCPSWISRSSEASAQYLKTIL